MIVVILSLVLSLGVMVFIKTYFALRRLPHWTRRRR
jgi:hypothetical protein